MLKQEILEKSPNLDIVIRSTDLSIPENVYQLSEGLRVYEIGTWINNAGFGNYDIMVVCEEYMNRAKENRCYEKIAPQRRSAISLYPNTPTR